MRLNEIQIKNFRKLKDCKIAFRDTTFLIGPNNAGKSSVFHALNALHKTVNLSREDHSKVYDEATSQYIFEDEVEIIAEYHNVPDEAHGWVGFKGRLIKNISPEEGETSNKIIYKKVWSLSQTKARIFLLEYPRVVNKKYEQATKVKDLINDELTEEFITEIFGTDSLDKKLSVAAISQKLTDLPQYWDIDNSAEPNWVENPGGIPGNVQSKLPKIIIIPAESCITELTSSNGALQLLLTELFDDVRKSSDNYTQAQVLLNNLAKELDPQDKDTDFGKLIEQLNVMVHNLFPESSVHVSASLDQPDKVIKPQFSVEMESNVKTTVNYQGHGMIRATAFQLLRFVQDFVNKTATTKRNSIICFEEPEIYLHPAAANQMRDAIYDLSGSDCQIVATTHSPFMVNLGYDKKISLTRFEYSNLDFSNTYSFNLDNAFKQLQGDEKQNLKMLLKVDDHFSRMFFTKKSIFVEGDTEEVVIRETIKRLGSDDKSRVIGNCEFIRGRGKAVFISIAKFLNALGINYLIVHDRDQGTPKAEAMNQPIVNQTGAHRRIMLHECVEHILGYAPPSSEKPYTAHKFISENWGDTFDTVSEPWKSTFIDICEPYLDHLK